MHRIRTLTVDLILPGDTGQESVRQECHSIFHDFFEEAINKAVSSFPETIDCNIKEMVIDLGTIDPSDIPWKLERILREKIIASLSRISEDKPVFADETGILSKADAFFQSYLQFLKYGYSPMQIAGKQYSVSEVSADIFSATDEAGLSRIAEIVSENPSAMFRLIDSSSPGSLEKILRIIAEKRLDEFNAFSLLSGFRLLSGSPEEHRIPALLLAVTYARRGLLTVLEKAERDFPVSVSDRLTANLLKAARHAFQSSLSKEKITAAIYREILRSLKDADSVIVTTEQKESTTSNETAPASSPSLDRFASESLPTTGCPEEYGIPEPSNEEDTIFEASGQRDLNKDIDNPEVGNRPPIEKRTGNLETDVPPSHNQSRLRPDNPEIPSVDVVPKKSRSPEDRILPESNDASVPENEKQGTSFSPDSHETGRWPLESRQIRNEAKSLAADKPEMKTDAEVEMGEVMKTKVEVAMEETAPRSAIIRDTDHSHPGKDRVTRDERNDRFNSRDVEEDTPVEEFDEDTLRSIFETDIDWLFRRGEKNTRVHLDDAGLVILHPFFLAFFSRMNLLDEESKFRSMEDRIRAVYFLRALVSGDEERPDEPKLFFCKILCGLPVGIPAGPPADITEDEKEEMDGLLRSVCSYWPSLKGTSPAGLRQSFLQRNGTIERDGESWIIRVEGKGIDILMDDLPWEITTFVLPWSLPFFVDWQQSE